MTAGPIPGEPGSPLLSVTQVVGLEHYPDADALARRVHQLRRGAGLDCTVGHASLDGSPTFPAVLVWTATPRRLLAVAAGPGARTPSELLQALGRTARRSN